MYTLVGNNRKNRYIRKKGTLFLGFCETKGFVLCIYLGEILNPLGNRTKYYNESYIIGSVKGYYENNSNNRTLREYFIDLEYVKLFGQQIIDYAFIHKVEKKDIVYTSSLVRFEQDLSFLNTKLFTKWEQKNIIAGLLEKHICVNEDIDETKYVRTKDLVRGKFYSNRQRNIIYIYLGRTEDKGYRWLYLSHAALHSIKNKNIVTLEQLYEKVNSDNINEYVDKHLNKRYELDDTNFNDVYKYLYNLGGLKC